RADGHAVGRRLVAQRGPVVHAVPGHVDRDGRADPGQAVDHAGVGQLLVDGPGGAGLGEHLEAGAGVAVAPGGGLDPEGGDAGEGGLVHGRTTSTRTPRWRTASTMSRGARTSVMTRVIASRSQNVANATRPHLVWSMRAITSRAAPTIARLAWASSSV